MCHRSHAAYPERLADTTGYQIGFNARSGAKIIDSWTGFSSNHDGNTTETRRQLSWVNERTKLISLTVGGNDVGFGDVMAYCARRLITKSCRSILQT